MWGFGWVFLLGWGWAWGLDRAAESETVMSEGQGPRSALRTVLSDFHSPWSLGPVKVKSGWVSSLHDSGRRLLGQAPVCPDRSLKAETPHRCNSLSLLGFHLSFTLSLETTPPSNLLSRRSQAMTFPKVLWHHFDQS